MTDTGISKNLDDLQKKIDAVSPKERAQFQPELHRLVERIVAAGGEVPARVLDLDTTLTEEAIEAQFDNLPV